MRTIEEIKTAISYYEKQQKTVVKNQSFIHTIKELESELRGALIDGIPLDRLEEICNAERENGCVVLPCADEIEELDLSVRAYNCLKRAGYDTISKLMRASNADLQQVRNLGSKCFEEVRDKLSALKGANHE